MPSSSAPLRRALLTVAVVAAVGAGTAACAPAAVDGPSPDQGASPSTVRVPDDAETISAAVDLVAEGGLILVEPGTYTEQVLVDKADVTLRGLDRNEAVIDAENIRPYGVVAVADGVSIENLTVTGATFYGVLVTGMHDESGPTAHGVDGYSRLDPEQFPPVQRFAIDHVTAYNNGLYGLYAFDAQHGVIRDSYASGSADSGIYVGQCRDCDILVTGNVAENNAVGFENANASDSVTVAGNRFSGNRVGMTFLSNYQEAFAPQRGNAVVGNLVAGNRATDAPAHAEGGFGLGIGISGGTANVFERNRIAGNPRAGVVLSNTEDLAALDNLFRGNVFSSDAAAGNGVDVANASSPRAAARGNCLEGDPATTLPADLFASCAAGADQPTTDTASLPAPEVPPGVSFMKVAAPPAQPSMDDPEAPARVLPDALPALDLGAIGLPAPDFLGERSRW
jgi:nitrous oxidase accessory protein NosD